MKAASAQPLPRASKLARVGGGAQTRRWIIDRLRAESWAGAHGGAGAAQSIRSVRRRRPRSERDAGPGHRANLGTGRPNERVAKRRASATAAASLGSRSGRGQPSHAPDARRRRWRWPPRGRPVTCVVNDSYLQPPLPRPAVAHSCRLAATSRGSSPQRARASARCRSHRQLAGRFTRKAAPARRPVGRVTAPDHPEARAAAAPSPTRSVQHAPDAESSRRLTLARGDTHGAV